MTYKSKKIVLTTLPIEGEFDNWTTPEYFAPKAVKYMPLGILSLASNLPERHEVVLLDPSSTGESIDEIVDKIEREKPDILGISAVTRRAWALNEILKKTSTPYKVVGGPHASRYGPQMLRAGADAVFSGGLADQEFARAVEEEPRGEVVICKTQINNINFPNRRLMGNIDFYFPKPKDSVLFKAPYRLPMFSSVGCPQPCSYCNVEDKIVQRSTPTRVLDEMEHLMDVGSQSIHVLDDNFNVIPRHLPDIVDEMDRRGFFCEWSGRGQTRMKEENYSIFDRMAEHGFKRMHTGIEAIDDTILRFFTKNETVADIEKFCDTMHHAGVDILGYMILGSPVEPPGYIDGLADRIRQLGIKHPFFNVLFPEADTKYYHSLLKDGIYEKDHWAEFMENPTPRFSLPYPYGEERKQEVQTYTDALIKEFDSAHKEVEITPE